MADYVGKKIKQLTLADSVNETDDIIVESSPLTGTPATKRTKLKTVSTFVKNVLRIGDAENLNVTGANNMVSAINTLNTDIDKLNTDMANKIVVRSGSTIMGTINNSYATKTVTIDIDTSKYTLIPVLGMVGTTNTAYGDVALTYSISGNTLNITCVALGQAVNPTVTWNVIGIAKG